VGVGATFTSKAQASQKVEAGTVSIHAIACQSASDDSRYEPSEGVDSFDICDGEPCREEGGSSFSASANPAATTTAGFSSTSTVTLDDLSTSPSSLPLSVPIVVSNRGTLRVDSLRMSVTIDPASSPAAGLIATVLFDGRVVAGPETVATLVTTPLSLLAGASLAPSTSALVQIDLGAPPRSGQPAVPANEQYGISALLTGSDR
jgi:hypothetical protein